MLGRVLIVAGSDSGGGAGIQADIKTVTALGGYAATAITALTAQNTLGVQDIHEVPGAFVGRQMGSVLDDIGADCIKTGMLWNTAIIEAVAGALEKYARATPIVVDPLILASDGTRLLEEAAEKTLVDLLVARATVVTPNIAEAEVLSGLTISSLDDMKAVAMVLLENGPKAVLITGGHLPGGKIRDVLAQAGGCEVFESRRIESRHTHGTGCTLASAIAAGIAQGMTVSKAVARAGAYVHRAIATAPGLGKGRGPLNHGHAIAPFEAPKAVIGIANAGTGHDIDAARQIFREYAESRDFERCFDEFDREMADFPGKYAPPDGALLVAKTDAGEVAGAVGLWPIGEGGCEMRRLYVRPAFRGIGAGNMLALAIIAEARRLGYRFMELETLPSMTSARRLYKTLGFDAREAVDGKIAMTLDLD